MSDDNLLEKVFNQNKDDWSYGVYTQEDTPVFLRVKNVASDTLVQSPPIAVEVYNNKDDDWEQGDGKNLGMITSSHFKKLANKQDCLNAARQAFYTPISSIDFDPNIGNTND
ncbi:MAG: hypothetical protein ACRBDI_07620 [Alphaproteobacteria bacterium]